MSIDKFYRVFEDKFRGNRELIKSRLEAYLPFTSVIKFLDPNPSALDLGCGRGEWLELLRENGFAAHGIDLDTYMLEACTKRGLDVAQKDALTALKEQANESLWIVSGFHIIEHLPFESLQKLVQESFRILKPGGLLIIETPNPENIRVGTEYFYFDSTHLRPIPSQLLFFLLEYCGFYRIKLLRLQESKELYNQENITLLQVIEGVSPDYAVVAQKQANDTIMESFNELFTKEYGLSLKNLAATFENRLVHIEQESAKVQSKIYELELFKQKVKDSIVWKLYHILNQLNKKIK